MGAPFGKGCWEDTLHIVSLQPQRNLEMLLAKYTGETTGNWLCLQRLSCLSLCEGSRLDFLNYACVKEGKEAFKMLQDRSEEQQLLQQHRWFMSQDMV